MRDILQYAKTRKEAIAIISRGKVLVNGQIRKEDTFPVGLMDIVTIPDAEEAYRILPAKKGLILQPIKEEEAALRLLRIESKTVLVEGRIQLNLHDGTNKIIGAADPEDAAGDTYQTLDVVKVTVPEGEITEQIRLQKGASAIIFGGQNRGVQGRVVDVEEEAGKRRRSLLATLEDQTGKSFQTILDFIFVTESGEKTTSESKVS
jgi:small subunit ribosomal protein S4e